MTIEDFLKDLDIINHYCQTIQEDKCQHCCASSVCLLNDICLDIPTRSSFEDTLRSTKKAVEIIKGGRNDKR